MTMSPDIVESILRTGLIDYIEFVVEYGPHTSAASPVHIFRLGVVGEVRELFSVQ